MLWSTSLIVLASFYAAQRCYRFSRTYSSLKFVSLMIASLLIACSQLIIVADSWVEGISLPVSMQTIGEWGHILSLSFILSALAVFIRQSKPVFAQFPLSYTALPLLIVASFFLVRNTYALKEWLIAIYQGGALLVAILMYSVYTHRDSKYGWILSGIFLFLCTFVLYWFFDDLIMMWPWSWKLLLSASILLTIQGFNHVDKIARRSGTSLHNNAI